MSTQNDTSIEEVHPDNSLDTTSLTTFELGQDAVSVLQAAVDFHNSQLCLTIVHRPAFEDPVMTTRTRSASFSDELSLDPLSLDDDYPESISVATVVSDPNSEEKEAGNNSNDKVNGFESQCGESSKESTVSSDEEDRTETLAVTLIRRALVNTFKARNDPTSSTPFPPSLPQTNLVKHLDLNTTPLHLTFFKAPEPSYVLRETEEGVTVCLTDDVTLKFFSIESEEIEEALMGLPTIAPKLRSLTEKAKEGLRRAVNSVMWELSAQKPNNIPEPQEMEDESKHKGLIAGLDVQVKFTVTATCFGEKMMEMTM